MIEEESSATVRNFAPASPSTQTHDLDRYYRYSHGLFRSSQIPNWAIVAFSADVNH